MKSFLLATSLASIASAIDLAASISISAEQTNPDWLTANLAAAYATGQGNSTEDIIGIMAIVNALMIPSSSVTVNCGCCDGGIGNPHEESHFAIDDDDHPCDTHYIPTSGGGVTVFCGCCGDGIIDPEEEFAPGGGLHVDGGDRWTDNDCDGDDCEVKSDENGDIQDQL